MAQQPQQQSAARARLQQIYREKIVPELMAKFGYASTMQVPRLEKITLNMGVSGDVVPGRLIRMSPTLICTAAAVLIGSPL